MAKCIFTDCAFPATGRFPYAVRCWRHTPEEQDSYPVLVTYTHEHVVWVAADSQEQAVASMQNEPYERTKDHATLADTSWRVEAPGRWDWDTVYGGGIYSSYQGLYCDAHVEAYRRHQWELAKTAEAVLAS